jgi:acetaldehyde dehydrogenase (acetylating)
VGRDYPLSIEKLCPVLSYYVVKDWREGCERCKEILRYGGMGHTMSIHSRNDQVILEFGLKKPAFRICVNTPATLGAIGFTTGLDPSMTLGCGGYGGNITSDNISPKHLLNIKRLAYEIRPMTASSSKTAAGGAQGAGSPAGAGYGEPAPRLPQAPPKPAPEPIAADTLTRRIDAFLSSRGIADGSPATQPSRPGGPDLAGRVATPAAQPTASDHSRQAAVPQSLTPASFVCEDDVRQAVKSGEKIVVGEKTIITPAARDAGEAHHVFIWQSYP